MMITYESTVEAMYIYFTKIKLGGVAETISNQRLAVDLDSAEQIVAFRLFESNLLEIESRLKYVLQHPQAVFNMSQRSLQLSFTDKVVIAQTVIWSANLDLDSKGRILGIEILFTPTESLFVSEPDDGVSRLSADKRLEHLYPFLVPLDYGLLDPCT
jgi:uncharacterized protein YuzE